MAWGDSLPGYVLKRRCIVPESPAMSAEGDDVGGASSHGQNDLGWGSFGAAGDIMDLQQKAERKTSDTCIVGITVDSGAVEVLAQSGFARGYPIKPIAGSSSGAKYRFAIGSVANQGETRAALRAETREVRMTTFQIAGAIKPLGSGGQIMSR